jgi:hypothetical protein
MHEVQFTQQTKKHARRIAGHVRGLALIGIRMARQRKRARQAAALRADPPSLAVRSLKHPSEAGLTPTL